MLMVTGGFGGAFQIIRVVSFILIPFTLLFIYNYRYNKNIQILIFCFGLCFLYILLSLLWTCNFIEGIKEVIYYICHMNLFLLFLYCSYKSTNPVKFIILGWLLLFTLTIPIAFIEIFFDIHLPMSVFESDLIQYVDGEAVVKKFASVTFGNYNGYVVMLCYISFFICLSFFYFKNYSLLIFLYISLLLILFFNASRGGLLCIAINTFFFLLYFIKKNGSIKLNKTKVAILMFFVAFFCIKYSTELFEQIIYRLTDVEALYTDTSRFELSYIAYLIIVETKALGSGVGSMLMKVGDYTTGITALHNLYLEILVQYGIGVFFMFCVFVYKSERRLFKNKNNSSRMFACSIFFSSPIIFVIDSGYLLSPAFWIFMASFYIISININNFNYENNVC